MAMRGRVKWFCDEKGYGFITPEAGGKDIFVHHRGLLGHGFKGLTAGQTVEFESKDTEKGPAAQNVKVVA